MKARRLYALRGAIQISEDRPEVIEGAVKRLFDALLTENPSLDFSHCVDIMFTITPDVTSLNPATALRKGFGNIGVALFCMQEPHITGMAPRMVRVLLHAYLLEGTSLKHCYLEGAQLLRPDLLS